LFYLKLAFAKLYKPNLRGLATLIFMDFDVYGTRCLVYSKASFLIFGVRFF